MAQFIPHHTEPGIGIHHISHCFCAVAGGIARNFFRILVPDGLSSPRRIRKRPVIGAAGPDAGPVIVLEKIMVQIIHLIILVWLQFQPLPRKQIDDLRHMLCIVAVIKDTAADQMARGMGLDQCQRLLEELMPINPFDQPDE